MKPTCLFIGRFQPFHIGHLMVVQGMTKVCGRIVIGIGSANQSKTPENPFSATDRKEMIQRALQAENIIPMFDVEFVEFPDQTQDEAWTQMVLEKVGRVDKVWTGSEQTKKCFEGKVEIQWIKEVPGFHATEIRELIKKGGYWEEKVPDEVVSYIKQNNLV
jgi:nicotinamide-nucleotide adenylyltransferase